MAEQVPEENVASRSIMDNITEKFHPHLSSSLSDDDEKPSISSSINRLFGRQKSVHSLLGGGKGTGFQSKGTYLFGHCSMEIKMVRGDSAGTVTAFYLSSQNSEHDEIDFEFLGNRTGQPYIQQTNVFSGGKGDREQHIYRWFDPTKDYHSYSVLWNMRQIVISVDDTPIRVFKNNKDLGVRYPFNQPMKIYSSMWNAADWATRGGLRKQIGAKHHLLHLTRAFKLMCVRHLLLIHSVQHWAKDGGIRRNLTIWMECSGEGLNG